MREVEARSRTRLKVQREDDMDGSTKERYIDIVGTRQEQKAALEMLLELATFCREDEGEILKDTRGSGPTAGSGDGADEGKDAQADPPLVLEVLTDEVGKILGRKGETVKVIERDSSTKVEVDKATGKLEIYGRKECRDKALELVLAEVSFAKVAGEGGEVLKDQPRFKPADGTASDLPPPTKLFVKDREAGRVIGRGGETVREIMEKTGADIKVQKAEDMRSGETDREIKIFGSEEQQKEALVLVLGEVTWAKAGADGTMLKVPPEVEPKPQAAADAPAPTSRPSPAAAVVAVAAAVEARSRRAKPSGSGLKRRPGQQKRQRRMAARAAEVVARGLVVHGCALHAGATIGRRNAPIPPVSWAWECSLACRWACRQWACPCRWAWGGSWALP